MGVLYQTCLYYDNYIWIECSLIEPDKGTYLILIAVTMENWRNEEEKNETKSWASFNWKGRVLSLAFV